MSSPISNPRPLASSPRRRSSLQAQRGFSLIELLVVIGIIAVLMGFTLYGVGAARRKAQIVKTRQHFNGIATALESYKADYKFYPGLDGQPHPGILAKALIGPGGVDPSPSPNNAPNYIYDGAEGPGFRATPASPVHPPYLNMENYRVELHNNDHYEVLDPFGNAIEYYPQRKNIKPEMSGSLLRTNPSNPPANFDVADGDLDADYLQVAIGDFNKSNNIDGSESFLPSQPYLLISTGPDGIFAPVKASSNGQKVLKDSDDVFNFDR